MFKLIDTRILIVSMLVSLLLGCAGTGMGTNPKTSSNQAKAKQQANKYMQMAGKGTTETAFNYKIRAAEQYIIAGDNEQAEKILSNDLNRRLDNENTAYKQIVMAQLSLEQKDPAKAHRSLQAIWTPLKLPPYLQVKFFSTRAEAHRRSGNLLESVQERIYLSKHLQKPEDRKANTLAIWDSLSQLPPDTLRNLQKDNSKDELNGWIVFANITKQYDSNPEQMLQALNAWRSHFPGHPAVAFMPDNLMTTNSKSQHANYMPTKNSGIEKPKKIALLLPLQGPHAQSAQAIRDGFLAAYYAHADSSEDKPKIQIYDTYGQNMHSLYDQAIAENADFIVGPLIKEDVEAINKLGRTNVPILALNVVQDQRMQDNIYQFGLSPEMEAKAVAEKAWRDGHRRAMIIVPKSNWGKRMQTAFVETWHELGGSILAVSEIQAQSSINKDVQQLLGIDRSEARAKQLRQLGMRFSFEPRRRQDLDMIFIATNAGLARQIKPLLNFYYAGKIPAYACSSVFNGKPQPYLDQDLNGIHFCDMPWILDRSVRARNTYKAVTDLWPKEFEQYARLYALGLDAYKISLQMDQLTILPELGISGMTGMLTMDQQQKIQRKLTWASFHKGSPAIEGDQG